eukprot:TRINITY_DN39000_c0_g1_i1.p1 TRINITY_DN39000_c0_g1~~TRINITY_DN39000_c0_g1_i1.p1  ORF type:complete len:476 (-),score=80.77 TRINITY_DN39000_c0_g1_i1:157-1584(-)
MASAACPVLFQETSSGKVYQSLGEAFGHPADDREGRIDVVLRELSSSSLYTLPFSKLYDSASSDKVLEVLEKPSKEVLTEAKKSIDLSSSPCYRHYKGQFYQEIGRAKCFGSAAEEVVYRTLYPCKYSIFTRPVQNFESEVSSSTTSGGLTSVVGGLMSLVGSANQTRRFSPVQQEDLESEVKGFLLSSLVPQSKADATGRVALVTGASQGLGREAALQLAKAGFLVFAAARNIEKLESDLLSEEASIRSQIIPIGLDVQKEERVSEVFKEMIERTGRLDLLVNNAGSLVVGTVEMVSMSQARDLFDTNFFGAMQVMQAALGVMRPQKSGCIINVSSIFSEIPTMNQPVYAASKAALDAITLGTREAVRPFGVSVHSLQPGGITDTAIGGNLKNGNRFESMSATNPYPIDDMVKDSVFDRIVPNGQKSADVAKIIVDTALNSTPHCLIQSSAYTQELAKKKLVDPTGNAMTDLKF